MTGRAASWFAAVALVLGAAIGTAAGAAQPAASPPATSYIDSLLARADALLNASGSDRNVPLAVQLLNEAATAGNTGAMRRLAAVLIKGDGVAADPTRAEALIEQAIAAGDTRGGNEALGDLFIAATPLRDTGKAAAAYQKAATAGSTGAMRKLAVLLIKGDDKVTADPAHAAALIRQAIAAGDTKGGNEALGDLYASATPLKDNAKAADAYQLAADAGSTSAMRKLAAILVKGDGVPAEPTRAEALLQKIVASGDVKGGEEAFGDLYRADSSLKDTAKAADAYQKAADAGNTGAAVKLAGMLIKGDEIPADPARAEKLLQKAIAAGETKWAPEKLGDLYLAAAKPQVSAGLAAYQQAADAGNPSAMRKLAAILIKGSGVAADPAKAETLLAQAVAAGDTKGGSEALGDLLAAAGPVHDTAGAVTAYQQAADAGSSGAMRKLAAILIKGDDKVPADPARAAALIRQAIAAGDTKGGNEALGDLYAAAGPLKDNGTAADAYKKAADAGSTGAMRKLAAILVKGDGVPPDAAKAQILLGQVVASGDVKGGEEAFGDFYRAASPLKDPIKAADAYQQAADAGNTGAMLKLAAMLTAGKEIPADVPRATDLLNKAIAAGDSKWAPKQLGDLILAGDPDKGRDAALKDFAIAAEAGNASAHLAIASLMLPDIAKTSARRTLVAHLRAAAALTSPAQVAQTAMHYEATELIFTVQELLQESGFAKGAVDGNFGAYTKTAVGKFCDQRGIGDCPTDFISVGVLAALLAPDTGRDG